MENSAPPSQGDTGISFPPDQIDAAGLHAFDHLVQNYPQWKKFEHTGCIYLVTADNEIRVGEPQTSYNPDICETPLPPPGTILVGEYHNHTEKEEFSAVDLDPASHVLQFLLTPSGKVYKYDPRDKTIIRLR